MHCSLGTRESTPTTRYLDLFGRFVLLSTQSDRFNAAASVALAATSSTARGATD